jgi:hypothetical protein
MSTTPERLSRGGFHGSPVERSGLFLGDGRHRDTQVEPLKLRFGTFGRLTQQGPEIREALTMDDLSFPIALSPLLVAC